MSQRNTMQMLRSGATAAVIAAVAASLALASAVAQPAATGITVGATDLGGVVTGKNGPEAGVWVIAETTDLPTKFTKIVVTDDKGRYLIPALPKANYSVFVRGYGLVDSPRVKSAPGKTLNLTSVLAPDEATAAEYYPPIYWFAMLHVPAKSEFPVGRVNTQGAWLNTLKTGGCVGCHGLGTPGTRRVPKMFTDEFHNVADAWTRRIQSGGAQAQMARDIGSLEPARALTLFGDWTTRIAKGELPFAKPDRPTGIARNVVVTEWDWGRTTAYLHDEVSTDRRNPRINAGGKLYGSPENSTDFVPILDPKTQTASEVLHPVRDPKTPSTKNDLFAPSAIWGDKPIWDSKTLMHNPMMDEKGHVWFTARIRPGRNPAFCKAGSAQPSAKAFPLDTSGRQLSMYDPASGKFTLIDTCFSTHHLNFASDANNTLWLSGGIGGPGVIGWFNRKMFEETGDEQKSQGWTPFIVDTNANGKRDAYVEPGKPADPTKDTRVLITTYAVAVSPSDGAVWGTEVAYPGRIVRLAPGADPAQTALAEVYEVPLPGFSPRGGDVDSNGVYWSALASGHLGSFDRRKCKVLNGPTAATGKQCPEGWTFYALPGPQMRDVKDPGSAESSYYAWVDRFNTFGLGKDVPIAMGNLNSSILALVNGKFVNITVPYPMGFFPKNVDGRIDDPNAGWKGKALYSTYGQRAMFHLEGGKENKPKAVKFELRPDPLAH
jgi:hypothetical protein